jgi:hypothetical protein
LGVVPRLLALYSGTVAVELVEVGMAYGHFLIHVLRARVDAPIRAARQLAPSGGSCAGVTGAA